MILFITSTALLLWALWLYWQHVIIPINNEQATNCNADAQASKNLGDCPPVCKTTVIEKCPACEAYDYDYYHCKGCNGTGIIELS